MHTLLSTSVVLVLMTSSLSLVMPAQAGARASEDLDARDLVLPGTQIPGDWELVDQRPSTAGDQQLNLYHELNTESPGRIVGLSVKRYDDAPAAAASIDAAIAQSRSVGQPGAIFDNLGDGPAVAFIYRIAETQLREQFGYASDALGETVLMRVDRYILTVQVGGPSADLEQVDSLAAQLAELQVSRVQTAIASAVPTP